MELPPLFLSALLALFFLAVFIQFYLKPQELLNIILPFSSLFLVLMTFFAKRFLFLVFIGLAALIFSFFLYINFYSDAQQKQDILKYNQVYQFEFIAESDGRYINENLVLCKGKIIKTYDRQGNSFSAAIPLFLYLRNSSLPFWNDKIKIISRLYYDDKFERYKSYCSPKSVKVAKRNAFFKFRYELRKKIINLSSSLSLRSRNLFNAIFLSYQDSLFKQDKQYFLEAGLAPILALSGMHIAILSAFFLFLFRPLLGKKLSALLCLPLLFFYLFLAGPSPSLFRAVIMFAVSAILYFKNIKIKGLDVLGLCFFILLMINPSYLYSLSFQLSFMAVCGILIFSPALNFILEKYFPACIRSPLSVSIAAQAAVLPIILLKFQAFYPVSLLSMIAISPLIGIFYISGIINLFICLLPLKLPFEFNQYFLNQLAELIFYLSKIASKFPAYYPSSPFSASLISLIMIILSTIVFFIILKARKRNELFRNKHKLPLGN